MGRIRGGLASATQRFTTLHTYQFRHDREDRLPFQRLTSLNSTASEVTKADTAMACSLHPFVELMLLSPISIRHQTMKRGSIQRCNNFPNTLFNPPCLSSPASYQKSSRSHQPKLPSPASPPPNTNPIQQPCQKLPHYAKKTTACATASNPTSAPQTNTPSP